MKASVIIAAHNESKVIERCLASVIDGRGGDGCEVIVVANGCTDDTALRASNVEGVKVVDLAVAGKARALNAGDAIAIGEVRVYLDADIVIGGSGIRGLIESLEESAELVAVPRRELVLDGRPVLVRAYYAIHSRLPATRSGLYGRGLIALSAEGRRRFSRFPEMTADDLYLDSLFDERERKVVSDVITFIETPLTTGSLIRRLARVRYGNESMRRASDDRRSGLIVRPAARLSWFTDVVVRRPWLACAALIYVGISVVAAWQAKSLAPGSWGQDQSTRR